MRYLERSNTLGQEAKWQLPENGENGESLFMSMDLRVESADGDGSTAMRMHLGH